VANYLVGTDLTFGSYSAASRPGPYSNGTRLFGVVFNVPATYGLATTIDVVQSLDAGVTWTAAGAGVVVPDDSSFGCDVFGDILYIAHSSAPGSDVDHWKLALSRFDMSTQTRVGTDVSAAIETVTIPRWGPLYPIHWFPILLACRGANDCVIAHCNPWTGWIPGAWITRWDGVWHASQKVSDDADGSYFPSYSPSAITNGTGGVQILYQNNGNFEIRFKVLADDDTLGAYVVVGLSINYMRAYNMALLASGGNLIVPQNAGLLNLRYGPEGGPFSSDLLAGFNITVPFTDGGYQINHADLADIDPDNNTLIWIPDEGDTSTHIRYATKKDGVWGPATTLYTPSTPIWEHLGIPADVFIRRDTKRRVFFRTADYFMFCMASRSNSQIYYTELEEPEPPFAVDCASPPGGIFGLPYAHAVTASGGTPPYTFAVIAGALPDGLNMDAAGLITGTPTQIGVFTFTVRVTDAAAVTPDGVVCSITVSLNPSTCIWLDLWVWRQLQKFTSLDEDVEFPPGYLEALRHNLAVDIATEFRHKLPPHVAEIAERLKAEIGGLNISNDAATEEPVQ